MIPLRIVAAGKLAALGLAVILTGCGSPEERAARYLANAQQLFDEGKFVEARLEAQNASQIAPKDADAHLLLARIAEHDQDFRVMFQRLSLAVDGNPKLVPARVKLGTMYFFGEAYDKAEQQARAATEIAPEDPEVRVLNARLLFHKKDQEAAVRELDAALAANPDLVDAILLRASAAAIADPAAGLAILDAAVGRLSGDESKPLRQLRIAILAQQNRKADVEQAFRDLIRDFPQDEGFQYQLARFYTSEGRVDEAEQVMRGVVKVSPDDVSARLGLAQFLAQMRSPEVAQQTLEAFIAENPEQPELRAALGRLYEADNKPDAALAVYEELAKRSPKTPAGLAARVRVAAIRIGKREIAPAKEIIDAVLADEPDYPEALLIRAGFRVQEAKYQDAVADVRTVLRKDPKNGRAMLLLARTHSLMGERVLAKDAYRRLIEADPKNADAPRELAALELGDRNATAAEQVMRDRIKAEPGDLDAANRLVEMLAARKAWSEAEAEARRIDSLPESKGLGQFQLARLYRAQGKADESLAAFRAALGKNPESPLALDGLVTTLQSLGRGAEAQSVIEEYRRKFPEDLSVRYIEGTSFARGGNKAAAEQVFSEIVRDQPQAAMAWVALANVNRDDAAKRIDAYKRGLAANPGNAELGLLLGSEYEQTGRQEEAIAHYQELLKANPDVMPAVNNLASLLCDYRSDAASYARALELAKRLESSTNPAVLDTIGWAYYRNKDYPRAVEYLRRAVDGAGEAPLLRYHLGMAYLASGNKPEARRELQQAVDRAKGEFPGLAEAKQALQQLAAAPAPG
jgi:tetratricopeptide (TPR) repeat protein